MGNNTSCPSRTQDSVQKTSREEVVEILNLFEKEDEELNCGLSDSATAGGCDDEDPKVYLQEQRNLKERKQLALEIARSSAFMRVPIIPRNKEDISITETDDEDSEKDDENRNEEVDTSPLTIDETKGKVTFKEISNNEEPFAADGDSILTENQRWELSEPVLHVESGIVGEPDLATFSSFKNDKESSEEESDIEQHFGINDIVLPSPDLPQYTSQISSKPIPLGQPDETSQEINRIVESISTPENTSILEYHESGRTPKDFNSETSFDQFHDNEEIENEQDKCISPPHSPSISIQFSQENLIFEEASLPSSVVPSHEETEVEEHRSEEDSLKVELLSQPNFKDVQIDEPSSSINALKNMYPSISECVLNALISQGTRLSAIAPKEEFFSEFDASSLVSYGSSTGDQSTEEKKEGFILKFKGGASLFESAENNSGFIDETPNSQSSVVVTLLAIAAQPPPPNEGCFDESSNILSTKMSELPMPRTRRGSKRQRQGIDKNRKIGTRRKHAKGSENFSCD